MQVIAINSFGEFLLNVKTAFGFKTFLRDDPLYHDYNQVIKYKNNTV